VWAQQSAAQRGVFVGAGLLVCQAVVLSASALLPDFPHTLYFTMQGGPCLTASPAVTDSAPAVTAPSYQLPVFPLLCFRASAAGWCVAPSWGRQWVQCSWRCGSAT
jgi:hypothetical protein